MAADKTPPDRRITLIPQKDGSLLATYTWKQFRFMLSDGTTVDVLAVRDDSDLRAAVLAHTGATAIAGVVTLTPTTPAPVKKAAKTAGRRRAAQSV